MSLPINKPTSESNAIVYTEYTLLDGSSIRVRNYKISDIENYLKRIQSKTDEHIVEKTTYNLIKTCTHPDDIDKLEQIDRINFIQLMVLLRCSSVSDSIPFPYECPSCKTNHIEHRIDVLPIDYEYEQTKIICFSDVFEITLRNIPFSKELELVEITDDDLRQQYELFYKIKYIRNNDTIYDMKNSNLSEFREWIDSEADEYHLNNSQYIDLITKLNSFEDSIKISRKQFCVACGHEVNLLMNNFTFFIMV